MVSEGEWGSEHSTAPQAVVTHLEASVSISLGPWVGSELCDSPYAITCLLVPGMIFDPVTHDTGHELRVTPA